MLTTKNILKTYREGKEKLTQIIHYKKKKSTWKKLVTEEASER